MLSPAFLPSIGMAMGWMQPAPVDVLRAYASAAKYVARYGRSEATQLLSDEERLLTEVLLDQAVGRLAGAAWTLNASAAEQAAATAAVTRLIRQLTVSSRFMDGYLRAALVLPIADGDANASTLEDCCLALTRFELADDCDNVNERMTKTAELWRTWLRDVSAGRVALVKTDTGTPITPSSSRVRTGRMRSGLDWSQFGSIR